MVLPYVCSSHHKKHLALSFDPQRLILALLAYFALGAYYNYSTYGARGLDLIP